MAASDNDGRKPGQHEDVASTVERLDAENKELRKRVKILRDALADCVEWNALMGYWKNKCWDRARAVLRAIKWEA